MIIFTDKENALKCIVGAMINYETGLMYYKDGVLIPEEKDADGKPKPRAPVACFVRKTRTITIKQFGHGLLMIPGINHDLIGMIGKTLGYMYQNAGFRDASECLLKRRSVHTAAEHLSNVTTIPTPKDIAPPTFTVRTFQLLNDSCNSQAAFTWLYPDNISDFISIMSHDTAGTIPVTLQLSGILYDPMGWFRFKNGETIVRNLTLRDFRWVDGQLASTCTYGNIMETMRAAVKTDLKPAADKQFPLLLNSTVREFDQYNKHPAYIPGFIRNDAGIHICPVRGPFFEIQKWLGRPEMFGDIVGIDSMYGAVIYEVEAEDVVWEGLHGAYERVVKKVAENPEFQKLKPEQICQRCLVPLYDDAYIVFPDLSSKKGVPYCFTCMHQRYSETGMVDPRGTLLCNNKVLARFKPKLRMADVLALLPNQDPEYLEILQEKYTLYRYAEKENDKQGVSVASGDRWCGIEKSIRDYVQVCVRWEGVPIKKLFMCRIVRVS